MSKTICCCKCNSYTSELGIHYFNSNELVCLSCEVKRSKSR